MAGKDIRSNFKLTFEAPGAEATKKKIDKINQALSPAKMTTGLEALSKIQSRNIRQMAALHKQVQGLSTTFKGLEKIVDRIGKAMDRVDGGGRGGGGGKRGGGAGGGKGPPKSPTGDRMFGPKPPPGFRRNPETGRTEKARPDPSFTRGVLQGAGLGDFFPQKRTPGMMRQAAGNVTGQLLRGTARRGAQIYGGISSMPFSGIQGLQQAAAGIPFVGGGVAGLIGHGEAAAHKALAHEQSTLGLAPFGRGGVESLQRAQKGFRGAGKDMAGMNMTEANQFGASLLHRGGGNAEDLSMSGLFREAAAAKTRFGVGPEATGAFQEATRTGGMRGNGGSALGDMPGALLEKNIQSLFRNGVDSSQMHKAIEKIADLQSHFADNGMEINTEALAQNMGTLARSGLGQARAMSMAPGIAEHLQGIATNGPRNASEMMELQTMGGFQGGGFEDLEKARARMANGGVEGGLLKHLTTVNQRAGGGVFGRMGIEKAVQNITGKTISPGEGGESGLLQKFLEGGGNISHDELAKMPEEAQARFRNAQDIYKEGQGESEDTQTIAKQIMQTLAPGTIRQAGTDNMQIQTGQKMLSAVQDLEEAMTTATAAMTPFLPELKFLTKHALSVAQNLPALTTAIQNFLEHPLGGIHLPKAPQHGGHGVVR